MIRLIPSVAMEEWASVRHAAEAKPMIRPIPSVAMGQ